MVPLWGKANFISPPSWSLTSGKQFLHKLEIIQSKLCKYIHPDKGGVAHSLIVSLKNVSGAFLKNLSDVLALWWEGVRLCVCAFGEGRQYFEF